MLMRKAKTAISDMKEGKTGKKARQRHQWQSQQQQK